MRANMCIRDSESTLHAIGWVLRHTYPFMVIDDDDPDNETWSRVAGQFAIRQVIRELEGPQYVRDYWNMDNFYRASGQAPGVYLEYARWLAANLSLIHISPRLLWQAMKLRGRPLPAGISTAP